MGAHGAGSARRRAGGGDPDEARQVAAKLQTAGALDEAAERYESYLAAAAEPAEARAKIAYSLGENYFASGRYEKALRWFYEAETLGAGKLADELDRKIVATLERLGRPRAAQAALDSRVRLDRPEEAKRAGDDPVVAKLGDREIHRSEVDRSIDDLPPEMARALAGASPADLLRRYAADELMWRKAQKLGYDHDPEVMRRQEALAKQLAVAAFLDREVVQKIAADEVDLKSFFEAHKPRYQQAVASAGAGGAKGGKGAQEVTFEQARPQVERDYRLAKAQEAYQKLIDSELAGGDVQLFPERMSGAPGAGGAGGGGGAGAAPAGGGTAPGAAGAPAVVKPAPGTAAPAAAGAPKAPAAPNPAPSGGGSR